jgi:site-specific DNA-cytosine methylase
MEFRVLGINSGIGVSLHPFKWDLIGNLEIRGVFHSKKDDQWKANFKTPLFKKYNELKTFLKKEKVKPNIIISSPDCGSGSILRLSRAKKLGNHKKNESLLVFFKAIKKYKPRYFLFENLETLFQSFPKEEFEQLLKKYRLIYHVGPVSKWGNSQIHRKRLVIVGVKKKYHPEIDWEKVFSIPAYLDNPQYCEKLYGDLPEHQVMNMGHVRELPGNLITMYAGFKCTIAQAKNHWQTELHNKKRWEVKGRKFSTAPGVYRNLAQDYPATARKANRQFDHNGHMLTPRQLARVQGVPDQFNIYVSEENIGYWINKGRCAVTKTPPYEISVWFKQCLDDLYFGIHKQL